MKYNIFSTLSANLNGDTFKSLITVFLNLLKTQVLLDEKANSAPFLDISRYMSELITRRCDTRDKTFSILWPKPCLSDSYKISIVIFDELQKGSQFISDRSNVEKTTIKRSRTRAWIETNITLKS